MSKEAFVKNNEGNYRVRGLVKPEEIVSMASAILMDDLMSREMLTSPMDAAKFLQVQIESPPVC